MQLPIRILRQVMVRVATAAFLVACASSEQQVKSETPADQFQANELATEDDDMDPSALARFREPLAPYGRWADDPTYGTIWIPNAEVVGPDFVPYVTAGHWALGADDQWTWVSDYDWGWAPFHYGRWIWSEGTGWAWIPGGVYAPAWVVWRTAYDDEAYVGWAPLPPSWYWFNGVPVRVVVVLEPRFVFVPSRHALGPSMHDHVLAAPRAAAIATRSRPFVAPASVGHYPALDQVRGPTPAVAGLPANAIPAKRATRDPRTLPPASRPQASPGMRAPQTPARPAPRSGGSHKGR
jgi:hypothetical protein